MASVHPTPRSRRSGARNTISAIPKPDMGAAEKEGIDCQICHYRKKLKKACRFCSECSLPLCKICADQHQATKVTGNHKIIEMKDHHQEGTLCPTHRFTPVQYFCESCLALVCVNCTMLDHRTHTIVPLSDKIGECKVTLRASLDELDTKITVTNNELKKIGDLESVIEEKRADLKKTIQTTVDDLHKKLMSQQEKLFLSVDHFFDSKKKQLAKRKYIAKKRNDDMMKLRQSSDLKNEPDKEEIFINNVIDIQKSVEVLGESILLKEGDFTSLEFIQSNNVQLGKLVDSDETLIRAKGPRARLYVSKDDSRPTKPPERHSPLMSLPKAPKSSKWQIARIIHKFKTSTYVDKLCGLGVLPNGKMIIADAANHGILVCDPSGRFQQRALTVEVPNPNGLTIDREGHIVVSTDRFIKTFRAGGEKVAQLMSTNPGPLAVDEEDNLFVRDMKSHHVIIYDKTGKESGKFLSVDKLGNIPDLNVLEAAGGRITLSYSSYGITHHLKTFNYTGELMHSTKIPDPCYGVRFDHLGNMIVASGELCFAAGIAAQSVVALKTVDRSGKTFKLVTRGIAFTPNGDIVTMHINQIARRSEVVILQLGA